jgi:hypothetical protein
MRADDTILRGLMGMAAALSHPRGWGWGNVAGKAGAWTPPLSSWGSHDRVLIR